MRVGEVSFVTPFRYMRMLFALVAGIVVFDESPDTLTLVGAAIIIASGVYTLLRERKITPRPRRGLHLVGRAGARHVRREDLYRAERVRVHLDSDCKSSIPNSTLPKSDLGFQTILEECWILDGGLTVQIQSRA